MTLFKSTLFIIGRSMTVPRRIGFQLFVRRFVCGLVAGLYLSSLSIAAEPPKTDLAKTILVVGDSLSAGYGIKIEQAWATLLDQRLHDQAGHNQNSNYRVINASVSGETSAGVDARIVHLLDQHHPNIVILEIGANDGLRGLPLVQMRQHLQSIVDRARERKVPVLLIGMRIPPNYGERYAEGFYNLFGEVAKERQLPLVPFLLDGVALDNSLMQADGLHPTAAAQPRLLDNVWRELQPMLKTGSNK